MTDDAGFLKPLRFDSNVLPLDERVAAWQSALSNFELSRRTVEPFSAVADVWLLDPLVLTRARVDAIRYDRPRSLVESDLHDHFAMVYLLEGHFHGDYGEGERLSGPGSLTVLDMRQSCWTDAEAVDSFVLSVPRVFLMARLGDLDPHGMVASGGLAPLLGTMLREIAETLPGLHLDHATAVARTIRDLVAETLLAAARNEARRDGRDENLIERVRAHVDDHLGDPLDVASICGALGVSRSGLYRAFGSSGGVLQQVRRRRLRAVRMSLADPAETRSIGELAAAYAFTDKSHLNRLFKTAYGCTPGRYRAGVVAVAAGAASEDAPEIFKRWTELLD